MTANTTKLSAPKGAMPNSPFSLPSVIPVSEQRNYPSIPIGYTTDVDGSWKIGSVYQEGDDE